MSDVTPSTDFDMPIESSHVLQFARACGYLDDLARSTPTPTFLVAMDTFDPDYDRRPRPDRPWWGDGDGRVKKGASGFHATTEFDFVRAIRVGEQLRVKRYVGEIFSREGRRGGTLTFTPSVSEFFDVDGELVATMTWTNVSTTVEVTR